MRTSRYAEYDLLDTETDSRCPFCGALFATTTGTKGHSIFCSKEDDCGDDTGCPVYFELEGGFPSLEAAINAIELAIFQLIHQLASKST